MPEETPQDSAKSFFYRSDCHYRKLKSKEKIESSTAISTFSSKEIQKQNPISAAALLQRVPDLLWKLQEGK